MPLLVSCVTPLPSPFMRNRRVSAPPLGTPVNSTTPFGQVLICTQPGKSETLRTHGGHPRKANRLTVENGSLRLLAPCEVGDQDHIRALPQLQNCQLAA